MEAVILKIFSSLFRFITFLMITGALVNALSDLQQKAFASKRIGLTSMLKINEQLVGKTK